MNPLNIYFCNKSTTVNSTQFSQMLFALSLHVTSLVNDWNLSPVNIISTNNASLTNPLNNTIFLFDNADQANALGYHYEYKGLGIGEVFAHTITGYYGNNAILYKDNVTPTVSSVLAHETLELIGNQNTNKWWMDNNGVLWAAEFCDPVQNNIYTITIPGGTKVAMSDYILPNWTVPDATISMGNFNKMNTLTAPFTVKNGYAIQLKNYRVVTVYGENFPEHQKADIEKDAQTIKQKFKMS